MDAVSYSHSAKQAQRIEKFIKDPDSTSGIVTVPKVIGAGESVTVPAGRVAVLPNVQVDGTLNIEGEVFILSGGSYTDTDIESNNAVFDTLKVQGQNVSPFSGFKNYIINGNFDIWQRGTSFTGLTNGTYSSDRWVVYNHVGDINYNVVRNTGIFNGGYGATYSFNSGTGIRSAIQFIENVTRFKVGSNVTVSFEAYTNSTPYTVAVTIQGVKGVWASATGEVSSNIALTNTKTKYSVTLQIPDWTSLGIDWAHLENTKLALKFNLGANTNGRDFILGSVQLEEGSVATPFENRPYGLELSLCQRYLPVVEGFYAGHAATSGEVFLSVANNVEPRVKPTGILSLPGGSVYYTNTSSPITNVFFFGGNTSSNTLKVIPTGTPLTTGQGVTVGLPKILFTGCEL